MGSGCAGGVRVLVLPLCLLVLSSLLCPGLPSFSLRPHRPCTSSFGVVLVSSLSPVASLRPLASPGRSAAPRPPRHLSPLTRSFAGIPGDPKAAIDFSLRPRGVGQVERQPAPQLLEIQEQYAPRLCTRGCCRVRCRGRVCLLVVRVLVGSASSPCPRRTVAGVKLCVRGPNPRVSSLPALARHLCLSPARRGSPRHPSRRSLLDLVSFHGPSPCDSLPRPIHSYPGSPSPSPVWHCFILAPVGLLSSPRGIPSIPVASCPVCDCVVVSVRVWFSLCLPPPFARTLAPASHAAPLRHPFPTD